MKIVVVTIGSEGCIFYRALQPAARLKDRGHEVRYFSLAHWNRMSTASTAMLAEADAILVSRPTNYTLVDLARDLNPRAVIIVDYDDDLFHLPEENQARQLFTPEALERVRTLVARADAVTVSTAPLAAELARWNRQVTVVPNTIDPALHRLTPMAKPDGAVRVGWAGSITHARDVHPAINALAAVMRERPNVHAVIFGQLGGGLVRKLDPERTYWQRPVPMRDYYRALHGCGLDVGLAPIRPHRFNDCKSEIKWLEYSAVGAACVASNVGPYRRSVRHGRTGLLAEHGSVEAWRRHILTLVDNPIFRADLVARARAEHAEKWRPEAAAETIEQVILEARARKAPRTRRAAPAITIAVPSFVPLAFQPGVDERAADMMQSLPRALARVHGENTRVVVLSQGSCEQARAFLRETIDRVRRDGLEAELVTSEHNWGVAAVNEIYRAWPAEFLLKLDDDVVPVEGFDLIMLDVYRELERRGERIGMLSLDPQWGMEDGQPITFGVRNHRAVAARTEIVSGHEVNWLIPRSTAVGMCRLKRAEKFWAWGGHPDLLYGTDQVCADRSCSAGFENAHLLPRITLRPGGESVPAPLVHNGSSSALSLEMKRRELRRMLRERGADHETPDDAALLAAR